MGGKAKIAVVIQRENGHDISESMALRILSFLSQKHLFIIHHLIRKVHTTFRACGLYHPQNPNMGGGVERADDTLREDFYDDPKILLGSIGARRFELKKAVQTYNEYRPHSALQGRTPMEYLRINQTRAA